MSQNLNDVKLPADYELDGKKVLKVISAVVSDKASDNGYIVLTEDGDKVFVSQRKLNNAEGTPNE